MSKILLKEISGINKQDYPECLLKDFNHENIVKYFDHFENEDFLFIVLEYCEVR